MARRATDFRHDYEIRFDQTTGNGVSGFDIWLTWDKPRDDAFSPFSSIKIGFTCLVLYFLSLLSKLAKFELLL